MTSSIIASGTRGEFWWLVTDCSLAELVQAVPQIVVGKYVAVVAFDSGPLEVTPRQIADGWESRHGIVYTPALSDVNAIPQGVGYEEWYVLSSRRDIGRREFREQNIFEPCGEDTVFAFVNRHFGPDHHDPQVLEIFWAQLHRIRPLVYIGDTAAATCFVTTDRGLYDAVSSGIPTLCEE